MHRFNIFIFGMRWDFLHVRSGTFQTEPQKLWCSEANNLKTSMCLHEAEFKEYCFVIMSATFTRSDFWYVYKPRSITSVSLQACVACACAVINRLSCCRAIVWGAVKCDVAPEDRRESMKCPPTTEQCGSLQILAAPEMPGGKNIKQRELLKVTIYWMRVVWRQFKSSFWWPWQQDILPKLVKICDTDKNICVRKVDVLCNMFTHRRDEVGCRCGHSGVSRWTRATESLRQERPHHGITGEQQTTTQQSEWNV